MTDNTSLIARLESAGEGSVELDREVWTACGMAPQFHGPFDAAGKGVWNGPHLSHSLDAALALAERVIEKRGPIDISIMGSAQVTIHADDPCANVLADAYAATPALALCLAILRASEQSK